MPDAIKQPIIEIPENINHFIEDPLFTYQDFSRRGAENVPSTFRVQDYSWDDHGFSLVNRLYNDVGHLLDLKFRAAYNLTYFTMADKTNVDTSKFRRAIWNYIQCIYGKYFSPKLRSMNLILFISSFQMHFHSISKAFDTTITIMVR